MSWKPGLVCRYLMQAAGVAAAIVFSLPGGAVLSELFWQATQIRLGGTWATGISLAAALVVAWWLFSPSRILCSAGWAIAAMGHAALANSMSPGRGIQEQLAWLGVGAALGAVVGPWLVRRQSCESATVHRGAEGTGTSLSCPSSGRFLVTLPMLGFWAVIMSLLLILQDRDNQRVAWQDQMATAVSQSRGHVIFDDFGVPTLVFPWRKCLPEDEAESRKSLRCIELGAKAGDEQLAQLYHLGLKRLPDLCEIRLQESLVTDNGLLIVAPLVQLQGLSVGPATTDVGLRHLNGLTGLRALDLSRTQITGAGLRHPRQLPVLQILTLRNTKVRDEDLVHLTRFSTLVCLDLAGTEISDAGLVYLTQLPNLRSLRVEHTRISDAGVEDLKRIPNLHWLFACDTRLTQSGANALSASRPGVVIQR